MKIAHLITSLEMGGAERQLKALVSDPEKSSLEHVIICLKDMGVIGKQLIGQPGVYLYCLNLDKSILGLWKLYQILRREKPDILQTWLYHADFLGLIFGKIAKIRRILWNVRCSNMDMSFYSWRTKAIVKILTWMSRLPDAIITNSHAGRLFHTKLGYKPKRWIRIPNGIDTDLFSPNKKLGQQFRQSLEIPEDALVVGMMGRVDPMKDYPNFLQAVEKLSDKYKNLYCLVAGKDTKTENWSVTPPRLLRLGLWGNVPQFLNALDILVLSSAFGEGYPNVVGEGMACGIPTVATNVGDAALLIQTETQIVPPYDVDKLSFAIKKLLALSPQERHKIGQEGRERIIHAYNLPVMRQRYISLYKSLR